MKNSIFLQEEHSALFRLCLIGSICKSNKVYSANILTSTNSFIRASVAKYKQFLFLIQ